MHRFCICAIIIVFGAVSFSARAQTPGEIGHQGILTDSLGNPIVAGSFELTFSLYDQQNGGTLLWTEQQTVSVEEGLFTALLGSVNPIDLQFDKPYWLDVEVDGDVLDPRLRFTASPYSRRAAAVDSVGPEAFRPGLIPLSSLNLGDAPLHHVATVSGEDSLGWSLITEQNIADKTIPNTKISPSGGGTGQVLTVQGDSVSWVDPPEITGAAIPNKSVRSTKLNSEDGEPGDVLLAAEGDSAVWSQIGSSALADEAVTRAKLSAEGAGPGQFLMAQGDSVAWVGAESLNDGSIPASKILKDEIAAGRVLLVTADDTAGWGLVSDPSIAVRGVSATRIGTTGGTNGQILTVNGQNAVWANPAGIADGSVTYDKLSPAGGTIGRVLAVIEGDTVGWALINASNIQPGSITISRLSGSGGTDGDFLQVDGSNVVWAGLNGTAIDDGTVPLSKIAPGPATAGNIITYNGSAAVWGKDSIQLPFSANVAASDTFGIRVRSPSVIEGSGFAMHGIMTSANGGAFASALRGENRSTSALGIGVWGSHEGGGWGVYGRSTSGRGIYGSSPDGFAGYFSGNVRVTGSIEKAGGSFKIDHPLDPENRYLLHSFVESPEMLNVYNGNATLNGAGEAVVALPDWFQALNSDFRYQLTAIGGPGPNLHIAQEIAGNTFRIAGGAPGMRVSWQVTGVRNDAWARTNRIPVEMIKEGDERGRYLHPEAFGVSPSLGIEATDQTNEQ